MAFLGRPYGMLVNQIQVGHKQKNSTLPTIQSLWLLGFIFKWASQAMHTSPLSYLHSHYKLISRRPKKDCTEAKAFALYMADAGLISGTAKSDP